MVVLLFVLSLAPCKGRANDAPVVSVLHDPFYAGLQDQIQSLVNICGFHEMNYFCVIAYGPQSKGYTGSLPPIDWVTQRSYAEGILRACYKSGLNFSVQKTNERI
jgi:hypothetical protein